MVSAVASYKNSMPIEPHLEQNRAAVVAAEMRERV
jgi:hypothetical protein